LFLGTPRLEDFRYGEMRHFARRAIEILARENITVQALATTVHGAGYGLDVEEALRSLILGFQQGLTTHPLASLQRQKNRRTRHPNLPGGLRRLGSPSTWGSSPAFARRPEE
jgi:hypothetical protein